MKFVNFLKKPNVLFVVAFLLISFSYNYLEIFKMYPHSLHTWRQADCLSITLNYYQHGMNFLEPEIHNLISDDNTSGKTIGEFPILYYFIALLWKIFGIHLWIYRLVGLLVVFWGLFSLFKITSYFLKDNFWAMWLPMILFTSPIFADYGISFLTNVTAFSLVLVAFRYIQLYYAENKTSKLYIAMLFFLLAGLLKTSSLISFVFLLVIFVGERIPFMNRDKAFLFKKFSAIIPMILVFIGMLTWYSYAESFNNIHKGRYTFNNLWPIWEMSRERIYEFLHAIRTSMAFLVFNIYTLMLFLIMFVVVMFTPRKSSGFFYYGLIILLAGSFIYSLFWFQALSIHDYYYIDLLFFIMFVPFSFLVFMKKNYETVLQSGILKVVFALFLLFNIYYTRQVLELRYFPKADKSYSIIPSQEMKNLLKWIDGNYNEHVKALENIKPYLLSIGVKQEDKVISIPDQSFNITLFLMNQTGWTEYGHDKTELGKFIPKGAKYLIINDLELKNEEYLKPFLHNKIGIYKNVEIYRLN